MLSPTGMMRLLDNYIPLGVQAMSETDAFLLTSEAAERLGVAQAYVRQLLVKPRRDGLGMELEASKRGRDLYVTLRSIEGYERRRRPRGRPPETLSDVPAQNRRGTGGAAEAEREYQRNYKREMRAALKKASGKSTAKKRRGRR